MLVFVVGGPSDSLCVSLFSPLLLKYYKCDFKQQLSNQYFIFVLPYTTYIKILNLSVKNNMLSS